MRIPPFTLGVVFCGILIAATQVLASDRFAHVQDPAATSTLVTKE